MIGEQPHLLSDSGDPLIDRRVAVLDEEIARNPAVFLAAVNTLGGLATGEAATLEMKEDEEPRAPETTVKATRERVKMLLEHNDIRFIDFDRESERAIYGNPEVLRRIKLVKQQKSTVVKQGSQRLHQENPRAVELRDELTLFKLGIFVERVLRWQEQTALAHHENLPA